MDLENVPKNLEEEVESLLSSNQFKEALGLMDENGYGVVQLSGRLDSLQTKINQGILSQEDAEISTNQLRKDILFRITSGKREEVETSTSNEIPETYYKKVVRQFQDNKIIAWVLIIFSIITAIYGLIPTNYLEEIFYLSGKDKSVIIIGNIVDTYGKPIKGIEVEIPKHPHANPITDENGRFITTIELFRDTNLLLKFGKNNKVVKHTETFSILYDNDTTVINKPITLFTNKAVQEKIIIAGKNFIESNILAEIIGLVMEYNYPNLEVDRSYYHGETIHNFEAINSGKIHIYPEYSGTLVSYFLEKPFHLSSNRTYHSKKKINEFLNSNPRTRGLKLYDSFGFNNTYTHVMLRSRARELGVDINRPTLTSLKKVSNILDLRSGIGYNLRPDGLKGIKREYDIKFRSTDVILHDKVYEGLRRKSFDIGIGYRTDFQLLDTTFLEIDDDRNFFTFYFPAPLVSKDLVDRLPNLEEVLGKLKNILNEQEMADLIKKAYDNKLNDSNLIKSNLSKRKLRNISFEFLQGKGIIKKSAN